MNLPVWFFAVIFGVLTLIVYSPIGAAIVLFLSVSIIGIPLVFLVLAIPTLFAATLCLALSHNLVYLLTRRQLIAWPVGIAIVYAIFIGYPKFENRENLAELDTLFSKDMPYTGGSIDNIEKVGIRSRISDRVLSCNSTCQDLLLNKSVRTVIYLPVKTEFTPYAVSILKSPGCKSGISFGPGNTIPARISLMERNGECLVRVPVPEKIDLLWEELSIENDNPGILKVVRTKLWRNTDGNSELLFQYTTGKIQEYVVPLLLATMPGGDMDTSIHPGIEKRVLGFQNGLDSEEHAVTQGKIFESIFSVSPAGTSRPDTGQSRSQLQAELISDLRTVASSILETGVPYTDQDVKVLRDYADLLPKHLVVPEDVELLIQIMADPDIPYNYNFGGAGLLATKEDPVARARLVETAMLRFRRMLGGEETTEAYQSLSRWLSVVPADQLAAYLDELGPLVAKQTADKSLVSALGRQGEAAIPYLVESYESLYEKRVTGNLRGDEWDVFRSVLWALCQLGPELADEAPRLISELSPLVIEEKSREIEILIPLLIRSGMTSEQLFGLNFVTPDDANYNNYSVQIKRASESLSDDPDQSRNHNVCRP